MKVFKAFCVSLGKGKAHNCPVHVVSRVVWKVEIVLHCFGSILIKIALMFANISSLFLLRTSSCNLTLINLFEIRFWQILIKQEIKTLSKANKMLPLQKWLGYVSSYPFGHTKFQLHFLNLLFCFFSSLLLSHLKIARKRSVLYFC